MKTTLSFLAALSLCTQVLGGTFLKGDLSKRSTQVKNPFFDYERIKRAQYNPKAKKSTRTARALHAHNSVLPPCPDNQVRVDGGNCVAKCDTSTQGATQSPSGGCNCDSTSVLQSNNLACTACNGQFQYKSGPYTCLQTCQTPHVPSDMVNGGCICPAGSGRTSDNVHCESCDPNTQKTDPSTNKCVPNGCNSDQDLLFGDKCVQKCQQGYTRVPGSETCAKNCDLTTNDVLFGDKCVPKCRTGFTRVPGSEACECTGNNDLLFGDQCVPKCPGQFTRVPGSTACECTGNNDLLFGDQCVPKCPGQFTRVPGSASCQCVGNNDLLFGDQCVPKCMENFTRVPGSVNCECTGNNELLFGDKCVPRCPAGTTRVPASTECRPQ